MQRSHDAMEIWPREMSRADLYHEEMIWNDFMRKWRLETEWRNGKCMEMAWVSSLVAHEYPRVPVASIRPCFTFYKSDRDQMHFSNLPAYWSLNDTISCS